MARTLLHWEVFPLLPAGEENYRFFRGDGWPFLYFSARFSHPFFSCSSSPGAAKNLLLPPPPPKVIVVQPIRKAVTESIELTGNTQAVNTVQLMARVQGYLDKVFFKDGQMVTKGQLLFLIQQDTFEQKLSQAEGQVLAQQAQLVYAQAQYDRFAALLPKNSAAVSEVDNWRLQRDSARANLTTARANRVLARLDLKYTRVAAPFSGRIDRRLQDPGNLVGSGQNNSVLAQITQIDPIYVYFTISDRDLARLRESIGGLPGRSGGASRWPVSVGLTLEKGYPHQGYIDFAATNLTATTGTLLMRGILPNPTGAVLPGLFARVKVPLKERVALLVPETAVSSDQQGTYLLVVNGRNQVERRGIKTGMLSGTYRAVEEGLRGNEWLVSRGLLKAPPGKQVTPVREAEPTGQTPEKGATPAEHP